jgi:hypothetical protein
MHNQNTIATKDTVSCPYYTLFWKIKVMPHIHAKHERKTQKPKYKENLHAMIDEKLVKSLRPTRWLIHPVNHI